MLTKKFKFQMPLLLLLAFVLVLSGCGQSGNNASAPPANEQPSQPAQPEQPSEPAKNEGLKPMQLTLVGGGPSGLWSLFGESVGNILREEIPGTQFSYETGSGVSNVINVANGKVPLGLAFNFELKAGLEGTDPFKEAVPNAKALTVLFNNQPYQVVISKEFADKYGIASFEDIVEKKPPIRVSTLKRGILIEQVSRKIFELYGFTYEDIAAWGGNVYHEDVNTSVDMMKDGRLDLYVMYSFAPDGKVLELATTKKLQLLSLNEDVQKQIAEQYGTPSSTVKAGSYEWQTENVLANNASLILMADPNMSEEDAYAITKTLVENNEKIKTLHGALKDLTPKDMVDFDPDVFHAGALKYYKEAGLLQ